MGKDYEDNWTTPKHIKIERAGEPRGGHRGSTKKKHRRKGSKARMDEIIAVKNEVKRYYGWVQKDSQWGISMRDAYRKWHAKGVQKLKKLLESALEDGIITEKGAEHVKKGICEL